MNYARYTVLLKEIMENESTKEKLQKALSTYPIYEPKNPVVYAAVPTRDEINQKLLNYYKYREIGFETIGRFLDELETAMCEIMPYYVQVMKSQDMMNEIEDIFSNVDIVEDYSESSQGKTTGTSTDAASGESDSTNNSSSENTSEQSTKTNNSTSMDSTNLSKDINAQTPANVLQFTGIDIDTMPYADNLNMKKETNNSSSEGEESSNGNSSASSTATGTTKTTSSQESSSLSNVENQNSVEHTFTKKGNQGVNTYAHDMLEFRQLALNVVQNIINDKRIKELFMLVY